MATKPTREIPRVSYSIRSAAIACDLAQLYILDAVQSGELAAFRIGVKHIIVREDLVGWLRRQPRAHGHSHDTQT